MRCQRDEGEYPGGRKAQESYAPGDGLNIRRQESGSSRGVKPWRRKRSLDSTVSSVFVDQLLRW